MKSFNYYTHEKGAYKGLLRFYYIRDEVFKQNTIISGCGTFIYPNGSKLLYLSHIKTYQGNSLINSRFEQRNEHYYRMLRYSDNCCFLKYMYDDNTDSESIILDVNFYIMDSVYTSKSGKGFIYDAFQKIKHQYKNVLTYTRRKICL